MLMKIIGLTGGIGCGKSMVAGLLREKFHCPVMIADEIGKEGMEQGGGCYQKIAEAFGKNILKEDGGLDREKLSSMVFQDKAALLRLNAIVHPYVQERILEEIKRMEETGCYRYAAVESAIMIEAGYKTICDEIWYVHATEQARRERLRRARGYSEEKIDRIMENQMREEEFYRHCSAVIENSSTEEALIPQLEILLVQYSKI